MPPDVNCLGEKIHYSNGIFDDFNFEQEPDEELDNEPPFYCVPALLPGKPVTVRLFGCFIFLGIACFMPLVDFVSDILTAGTVLFI